MRVGEILFLKDFPKLEKINELLFKGNLLDTLEEIKEIEKNKNFNEEEKIAVQIIESSIQQKLGQLLTANKIIDVAIARAKKISEKKLILYSLFMKGEIQFRLYYDNNLLEIIQDIELLLELLDNMNEKEKLIFQSRLSDLKSYFYIIIREAEKAIQDAERSLNLKKRLKNDSEIARTLLTCGKAYKINFDFENAIQYYKQALKLYQKLDDLSGIFQINNSLGFIYQKKFDINQAKKYFEQNLQLSEKLNNNYYKYQTLIALGLTYSSEYLRTDVKLSLNYLLQAQEIAKDFENPYEQIIILSNIALNYNWMGKFDQTMYYLNQALGIYNESFNERPTWILANLFRNMCLNYLHIGDLELGLEYAQQSVQLIKKTSDKEGISLSLYFLGSSYWLLGLLEEAIKYEFEALEIAKKINNILLINWITRVIGRIYLEKGELDKALKLIQNNIEIFENLGEKRGVSETLWDLATLYYEKGDLDYAINYALKCYEIKKDLFDIQQVTKIIFHLIIFYLENNMISKAQSFLNKLEKINKEEIDLAISQRYRTAKALFYKYDPKQLNKEKSAEIFASIIDEEVVRSRIVIIALLNLCDLLLEEFLDANDMNILDELEVYTKKLVEYSNKQDSYKLRLESQHIRILTLWLHAQNTEDLSRLIDIQSLLTNTKQIAEKKGLFGLAQRIFTKHKKLMEHLKIWDESLQDYYDLIKT